MLLGTLGPLGPGARRPILLVLFSGTIMDGCAIVPLVESLESVECLAWMDTLISLMPRCIIMRDLSTHCKQTPNRNGAQKMPLGGPVEIRHVFLVLKIETSSGLRETHGDAK
jgi:hypothetical protein